MDVTLYVLFVFFKVVDTGGAVSHEFIGKQACEQAAIAISEKWRDEKSFVSSIFTVCVPK